MKISGEKGRRKQEKPRYIVDGFVFHVNIIKGTPPMTYLRCLEYKRLGCHARATIPHKGTINDIKLKKCHNHPPDYAAEEKIVFLRELKDVMLKNEKIAAKEVYELLSPMYPNASRETPYNTIKAKMNRWRRISDPDNSDHRRYEVLIPEVKMGLADARDKFIKTELRTSTPSLLKTSNLLE